MLKGSRTFDVEKTIVEERADKQHCALASCCLHGKGNLITLSTTWPEARGQSRELTKEAGGGARNLLDWLIRPFPNSQEGNGLPVAVTKKPMAKGTSCLNCLLPRSVRIVPSFTVVLLKFGNRQKCPGGKKPGDSFNFKQQIKMENISPSQK